MCVGKDIRENTAEKNQLIKKKIPLNLKPKDSNNKKKLTKDPWFIYVLSQVNVLIIILLIEIIDYLILNKNYFVL